MARDQAVASLKQLRIARKIIIIKRPVRMIVEFLIPLVKAIGRSEECNRVRDVNRDRHFQLPTGVPHGIEPRVVNFHQFARRDVLAQIEPERL